MLPQWAKRHPAQIFICLWRNPPSRRPPRHCSQQPPGPREGKAPYVPQAATPGHLQLPPDPASQHREHHRIQSSQSAEPSPWSPALTWPPRLGGGGADGCDLTSRTLGGRGQRSCGAHLGDGGPGAREGGTKGPEGSGPAARTPLAHRSVGSPAPPQPRIARQTQVQKRGSNQKQAACRPPSSQEGLGGPGESSLRAGDDSGYICLRGTQGRRRPWRPALQEHGGWGRGAPRPRPQLT